MTTNTNTQSENLPFLTSQERLDAYNLILAGCSHIWSKGKLQEDKAQEVLELLIPLTQKDPYFLAHLTSYAITKTKSKDLQVFLTHVASLSSADGLPFSPGSKYKKPNLRFIAAAALHSLDPKLALRVVKLSERKYGVQNYLNTARHFPQALQTAAKKYLKYREGNIHMIRGIKKAGLGETFANLYRSLHTAPSNEAAKILRWNQKDGSVELEKSFFDFTGMDDIEIAKKIQSEKLPVLGVLGALPRKMTPVIAVALLEQATGDQAVILRETFEDAGVLKDAEVMKLYTQKIETAKTALDRVETLTKTASEEVKRALNTAKSNVRKEEMKGLGKIYLHIDFSDSMHEAIEFAKKRGAIIAECVNDPINNFRWGLFGSSGLELQLPQEFEKDAFEQILFGQVPNGSTNCFALYSNARNFGADVDIFITDQGHNFGGPLKEKIEEYHKNNPAIKKPKACVIVDYAGRYDPPVVKQAYEENGIPVSVLKPDTLTQSALVVDSVKNAIMGPVAVVDEIMATDLLVLPNYYYAL